HCEAKALGARRLAMKRRTFVLSMLSPIVLAACGGGGNGSSDSSGGSSSSRSGGGPLTGKEAAIDAVGRAWKFMTEEVAVEGGGYVWSYQEDFKRRWGEMEATDRMLWVQPPGTPLVGHLFLDAYHATGDECFYKAAEAVALALVKAQHPAGGWN